MRTTQRKTDEFVVFDKDRWENTIIITSTFNIYRSEDGIEKEIEVLKEAATIEGFPAAYRKGTFYVMNPYTGEQREMWQKYPKSLH